MIQTISSSRRIAIMILLLSMGWCTSSSFIPPDINEQPQTLVTISQHTPGEDSNPTIQYYLRNYYSFWAANLDLDAVVRDPDGVDLVVMMYSQVGILLWSNITMDPVLDENDLYRTQFALEYNSSSSPTCYQVLYVANDSLGNWAMTPFCNYSADMVIITVDSIPELHDTPDLIYKVGTVDHHVTWRTVQPNVQGCYYNLYMDDYLIGHGSWYEELEINVDGLDIGVYEYRLEVVGGFGRDEDSVTVEVVSELPTSAEPGIPSILDYLYPLTVIGFSTVCLVVVYLKRRSQRT